MKIILCLTLLGLCVSSKTFACTITNGFIVQIENKIPDSKVFVHCQSKDDDLGDHWLTFKQEVHWHFCENFLKTTRYRCHFEWNQKEQDLDVFNKDLGLLCFMQDDNNPCNWSTMTDGIYWYNNNTTTWLKRYDWKPKSI
ncbi:plant self-incompatibility S1 [Artemisia annua]|uniref:S-protein homolog n=1 Tax=Artemisia annua TaxID=35608 RepID=A0A2U1PCB1_ARTAN|nr:plant self-incompatibility S1 [Artemisia annua]